MYVPSVSGFHSNIRKYLGAPGASIKKCLWEVCTPTEGECPSPDTNTSKYSHYESVWGWHIFEKTSCISSSRLIFNSHLVFLVSVFPYLPQTLPRPAFMEFLSLPFNNHLFYLKIIKWVWRTKLSRTLRNTLWKGSCYKYSILNPFPWMRILTSQPPSLPWLTTSHSICFWLPTPCDLECAFLRITPLSNFTSQIIYSTLITLQQVTLLLILSVSQFFISPLFRHFPESQLLELYSHTKDFQGILLSFLPAVTDK